MTRTPRATMAALAVGAALVLAACGNGERATPGSRPASTAEIEILEPEPGAVVGADEVTVRIELSEARIVEETTTEVRPDEGHVHLTLNGETITLLGGLEETIEDLEPGTYVLEVEFAAGDHAPFDPRVIQSTTFTVE